MASKNEEAAGVAAFDAIYTTNELQKLKILLPCLEPSLQKHLAVYIKYRELCYTMQYVRRHASQLSGCSLSSGGKPDLYALCGQLSLYSTPEEIRQLEQLQNMGRTWENMQEMAQTMSALQELFPDSGIPPFGDGPSPFDGESGASAQAGPFSADMLLGMLTPEQRAMYDMFLQRDETG